MIETLYQIFEPKATWAIVVLLFFGFIFSAKAFEWRQKKLGDNQTLDTKLFYTPESAAEIFGKYDRDRLRLYAYTELTLDIVFPFIYGLLLLFLMIRVFSPEKAVYLILLPIVTALADLCENVLIAYLALSFDGKPSKIAAVASVFTVVKIGLLVVGAIALLLGAAVSFFRGTPA